MNQEQIEEMALMKIMNQISQVMNIKNPRKLRKLADICRTYYAVGFEQGIKSKEPTEEKPKLILTGEK